MISKQSQLRIRQLRIRVWAHIVIAFVDVSFVSFLAIKHVMVGVVILIVFAAISARIIVKSAEELSRLNEHEPDAG
jgi:hypothetical protein